MKRNLIIGILTLIAAFQVYAQPQVSISPKSYCYYSVIEFGNGGAYAPYQKLVKSEYGPESPVFETVWYYSQAYRTAYGKSAQIEIHSWPDSSYSQRHTMSTESWMFDQLIVPMYHSTVDWYPVGIQYFQQKKLNYRWIDPQTFDVHDTSYDSDLWATVRGSSGRWYVTFRVTGNRTDNGMNIPHSQMFLYVNGSGNSCWNDGRVTVILNSSPGGLKYAMSVGSSATGNHYYNVEYIGATQDK